MAERTVTVDGVRLCLETFGGAGDPAVLLISGMSTARDAWDPALCERLAAAGRHVVRYDHRDAGRSSSSPPGEPDYGFTGLVDDVVRVLDAAGAAAAHLVGPSMGAGIAAHVALAHPQRVHGLTLIGSSPGEGDLPPRDPALAAALAEPAPEPDWSDVDAVAAYLVEVERPFAGPGFDEQRARRAARATAERTLSVPSLLANHPIAVGGMTTPRLADVAVPTLVLHGTADPLLPLPHGEAVAAIVSGAATFHPLHGVGHEVPPPRTWGDVVPALVRHTALSPTR